MQDEFSLSQLEQAINILRARHPSSDGASLCAQVRALAEPYTLMFMEGRERIVTSALSPAQVSALAEAFNSEPPS